MPSGTGAPGRFRSLLPVVGLLAAAAMLLLQLPRLADPALLGVDDFVEYWAAVRLNALQGNPYDWESELWVVQQQAGVATKDEVVMMWNPPWTFTFVMPFGLVASYPISRLLWLVCHLIIVLVCADWLWRF
jgi:hypothetical protein